MDDSRKPLRRVTPRNWPALTVAGAAMGLAVAGQPLPAGEALGPERLWLAQSSESGEAGEGGESAYVADGDEVVELLTDLGMLEGHLRAGVALYQAGFVQEATGHLKRPEDDIYDELRFHLADFGAEDFSGGLTALADAVKSGASPSEVEVALDDVLARIAAARAQGKASDAEQARALVALLRDAADEYSDGVRDGKVIDEEEYQTAWGYLEVARARAEELGQDDEPEPRTFGEKTLAALDEARDALPSVVPGTGKLGDASALLAAVAKVELAAYRLR